MMKFELKLDTAGVMGKLVAKEDKVLRYTGFFGRRVMRNSMRKAPKKYKPQPGKPPRWHSPQGLRTVVFGVDKPKKSLAIGPLLYKGNNGWSKPTSSGLQQRVSGKGGVTLPQVIDAGGTLTRETRYQNSGNHTRTQSVYRAFPYRGPAFTPTMEKMAELLETIPL